MKLQRLRMQAGWKMIFNNFLDINVTEYSSDSTIWLDFTQDIMHMKYESTSREGDIDLILGWYPENDPSGAFYLRVIEAGNWKEPVQEFSSRNKDEIVEKIEYIINFKNGRCY